MDPNSPPQEEVFSGPLSERLVHKNWKARSGAYEELQRIFNELLDDTDPKWNEYGNYFPKIVVDSNAAAQEKGLIPLVTFLDRAKCAPKHAGAIAPLLVEKCLSGKEKTKAKAAEALLMTVEIEVIEPVITSLLKGATHKVPKVCATSLSILTEIVKAFGPKPLPLKQILSPLTSFFDHSDKLVRTEASNLTIELYKWIGPVVQTTIQNLRPAQIKELEAAFAEIKGKPTPTRYLRSQIPQPGLALAVETQKEETIDPFDLVEAVEILSKIKDEWYENTKAAKWSIRKDALEALITLADVPKLQPGNYGEIVATLKKLIGDVNVVVVSKAAKCIALLAKGLRQDFKEAKGCIGVLLEKLKEKKATVVEPIREALDNIFDTGISLLDVDEEIQAACSNKVPSVRSETVSWILRCLKKCITSPSKRALVPKLVKPYGTLFLTLLDDTTPEVRDFAAEALGVLVGLVGERAMQGYLNKLDKVRLAKVKEFCPQIPQAPAQSVETKEEDYSELISSLSPGSKESGAAKKSTGSDEKSSKSKAKSKPAASTKAPASKESKSSPSKIVPSHKPTAPSKPPSGAPSKLSSSKASTSSSSKTSAPSGTSSGKPKESKSEEPKSSPSISTEEALNKAKELIPASILEGLANSVWKQRLAGMDELAAFVEKLDSLSQNAEIIIIQLQDKPGWKESNFQVMSSMFKLIAKLVLGSSCTRNVASSIIPVLVEKLADTKLKTPACECLEAFTEKSSPQYVISLVCKAASQSKSPKVLLETINWISTTLLNFGIASLQLKFLIDFLREALESSNPSVRTATIKNFGILHRFVGSGLRDFIADLKPALLNQIDEEFSKAASEPAPSPSKKYEDANKSGGSSSSSSGDGGGSSSNDGGMGGGLPREDISGAITSSLLKELSDNNWNVRKGALDKIIQIVNGANKRIEPNLGGLMPALKPRLSDTNKNLIVNTLEVLGLLGTAAGPGIEKSMKTIVPSMLICLGDSKKNIKDAANQALDLWITETTLEPFLPYLPAILEVSTARKDILTLAEKFAPSIKHPEKVDYSYLIKSLILCLEDKTAETRKIAENFLKFVAQYVDYDLLKKNCSDLKPASKLVVLPIIEQLKSSNSNSAPASLGVGQARPRTSSESEKKTSTSTGKPPNLTNVKSKVNSGKTSTKTSSNSQTIHILLRNDQKEARANKNQKTRWSAEEVKPGTPSPSDQLSEQFSPFLHESFHAKLFSPDFNKQLGALNELGSNLSEYNNEIIDNLDLLFKWFTLRLVDTNMKVLKSTIDFLTTLFTFLDETDYHLTDYEASILIPYLVNAVGNNNETIRQIIRNLFKQLCKLYPASKLFRFLFDGLKSKNSRIRIECIEEIGYLIERQNVFSVFAPNKILPPLAELIADRDANVRNASLGTLVKCHHQVGQQEFWKILNSIPDTSKDAIKEKFKYDPPKSPTKQSTQPPPKSPTKQSTQPLSKSTTQFPPSTSSKPIIIQKDRIPDNDLQSPQKQPSLSRQRTDSQSSQQQIQAPSIPNTNQVSEDIVVSNEPSTFDLGEIQALPDFDPNNSLVASNFVDVVRVADQDKVIEALRKLCLSQDHAIFILEAEPMVNALSLRLKEARNQDPPPLRLFKYLLNALHKLFSINEIPQSLSQKTLQVLITQVIECMIAFQEPAEKTEDSQALSKALNLLTLAILEKCDFVITFTVLLQLLKNDVQESKYTQTKFSELIMKCLLKQTKILPQNLKKINPSYLFRDIHTFLDAHPPAKWKGKSTDMPLRTVKTILNELVNVMGKEVLQHLAYVPNSNPPPAIISYLNLMLQSHSSSASSSSNLLSSSSTSNLSSSSSLLSQSRQPLQPVNEPQIPNKPAEKTFQQENQDPNNAVGSYMEKLKNLQQQYALKSSAESKLPSNSSSSIINFELNTLSSSSSKPTETSVQDLKQRLAKIKQSISTQNETK